MSSYSDILHSYIKSLLELEKLMGLYKNEDAHMDDLEELWHHMYGDILYYGGESYYNAQEKKVGE